LSDGANGAPRASWLAFGEVTRREEGEESGMGKEEKGRTGKGNGRKGTGGQKRKKRREWEGRNFVQL